MKKILLTVAFLGLLLGLATKASAHDAMAWLKSAEATYYKAGGSKKGLEIITVELTKAAPSPEEAAKMKKTMENLLKESEEALTATKFDSGKYTSAMNKMGEHTLDAYESFITAMDKAFKNKGMSDKDRKAILAILKEKASPTALTTAISRY
ncbi:hypothetical protein ABSA28_00940 [Candidatus Hepatincolaceae symbiont of Richtersius coronifer]